MKRSLSWLELLWYLPLYIISVYYHLNRHGFSHRGCGGIPYRIIINIQAVRSIVNY